jgi:hypothetical protein
MHRATWLSAIAVVAAAAVAALSAAGGPAWAQGGASPPCTLAPAKAVAPPAVSLGYSTRVELRLQVTCPMTDVVPVHIMLVLDGSGSMSGEKNAAMKRDAKQFVRDLDLPNHPLVQAAVVKYNAAATTLCKLTNDVGRLVSCIGKIDANGGSGPDQGLALGYRELAAGRPGPGRPLREIIALVTDGGTPAGCQAMVGLADPIKADGVEMVTVGIGNDADHSCLQRLASGPDAYFRADAAPNLAPAFLAVVGLAHNHGINTLTVADDLPANMRLLTWTAAPAPAVAEDKHLEWHWRFAATGDFVMSYWLTPQELGDHPVNVLARANLVDDLGRTVTVDFPVPIVQVQDNAGIPSPTPWLSPTPTVLPTRTLVPTRTPEPTKTIPPPTVTPTPPPARACPQIVGRVPAPVIADALANPEKVGGWLQRCNPGAPPGPLNGPRTWLGLKNGGQPFHLLFNGVQFKCGCP